MMMKSLTDYLDNPNLSCCLIFQVNGKADQRKRSISLLKNQTSSRIAPLDKVKLEQWIKAFQRKRENIDAQG